MRNRKRRVEKKRKKKIIMWDKERGEKKKRMDEKVGEDKVYDGKEKVYLEKIIIRVENEKDRYWYRKGK